MGFGAEMEMRMYVKGEDEGDDSLLEDEHSPVSSLVEDGILTRHELSWHTCSQYANRVASSWNHSPTWKV